MTSWAIIKTRNLNYFVSFLMDILIQLKMVGRIIVLVCEHKTKIKINDQGHWYMHVYIDVDIYTHIYVYLNIGIESWVNRTPHYYYWSLWGPPPKCICVHYVCMLTYVKVYVYVWICVCLYLLAFTSDNSSFLLFLLSNHSNVFNVCFYVKVYCWSVFIF